MTTKDEVKALWKLCFTDSDEFTDLYFDLRYKDDINMAVREDGKIISALQMISYPMTFAGRRLLLLTFPVRAPIPITGRMEPCGDC